MSIIFDIDKLHKKINFSLFPEIIYVLKIKLKKIYILTYIYISSSIINLFIIFYRYTYIIITTNILYLTKYINPINFEKNSL